MMKHIKTMRVGLFTTIIAIETNDVGVHEMPIKNTEFFARNKLFVEPTIFLQEYGEYEGSPYNGMIREVMEKAKERFGNLF